MRLKTIKLAGFKSFVDPTTVQLPSNMTAVVGPNGCGKSNIIDAVRWVMGESSAKHLRGESMTDVIFNGSNTRKPVGQASIELIFDNADGSIGGEYARFSEISIRRRVTRDSDNAYFLNGTKCRRRDITDIFLGTGLGPRSYAIIEQGMISRLIEAKPDELRIFVEEAAGISKYKERRRDTENRIRRTRENLERLTDIREELERQLQHLQRQARTAERYQELKSEERLARAQLQALEWRALDEQFGELATTIRELEVKVEAALADRQAADTGIEKHRQQHSELSEQFNSIQGEFYSLGADIARAEQQLQHRAERERQLREDLEQTEGSLDRSRDHLVADRERLAALQREVEEMAPQVERSQAVAEESAAALDVAEESMQAWQQRWDSFNQAAAEPRQQAEVQQSRIQHLDKVVERLGQRLERLEAERAELVVDEHEAEVIALEEQLAEVEFEAESIGSGESQVGESLVAARSALREAEGQLNDARTRWQQLKGRHASLEALQQAALSGGGEATGWLEANGLDGRPRLADEIAVEPGWERAVETVLGDCLQAVRVDAFAALADQLQAFSDGELVLLSGSVATVGGGHDGLQPLAAKVRSAAGAGSLLGGVYCTNTLVEALRQQPLLGAGESLVTADGIWLGRDWLRVARGSERDTGIIERQRELDDVARQIAELETTVDDASMRRESRGEEIDELERRRETLQQQMRGVNARQSELASALSARKVRIEQTRVRRESISREINEAREQLAQEQVSLREARALLAEAVDAMGRDTEQREQLLRERDDNRAVLDAARQQARHDKDSVHQLAMSHQSLSTQTESVEHSIERLGEQLAQLDERRELLTASLEENAAPVDDVRIELEQNLEKRVAVEERLAAARRDLEAVEYEMREAETARNAAQQRAESVRSELERYRLERQTVETRRRTLTEQLAEASFELEAVLNGLPENASAERWREELERIGVRIQRLGPINLAAIDEYQSQAERKHYLDAQNADLEAALETLESAIRKIDRETRARFKETFDEINNGIQELFPRVFGGGHAYLELTGDDLLDTGIAIMARPPGKRNSTIHLLSGGEKALTAIALVFAIFRLNPAPFCMLDEVDAPLDDANVGRYARMVKEMSEHVQFIFITHNKITMEHGDRLMGVTMQEPGVSRLVSVDIEEAAELAAV